MSAHLCCQQHASGTLSPAHCLPATWAKPGTWPHHPPSLEDSLAEPLTASPPPQPGSWPLGPSVASDPGTLCSPLPSLGPTWTPPDGNGGDHHSWSRLQHMGAQRQPRRRRRAASTAACAQPGRTPVSFTLCAALTATSTRLMDPTSWVCTCWVCTCPFGCCCGAALRKLQSPLLRKQIFRHIQVPLRGVHLCM